MATVECGRCGWTSEVDEDLPVEYMQLTAEQRYSEHMLEHHPDAARNDAVVQHYVRVVASVLAPTNGAMGKRRG